MGTRNYRWHFILSLFLCTIMALEGGDKIATTESHVNVSRSANNDNRTGPNANSSNASVAKPNTQTPHSFLGTTSLSPSRMSMVDGDGWMVTTPTTSAWEETSLGMPPGSGAMRSAFSTAGNGTTVPNMGTESGINSSPPLSLATTSRSLSSSSSSSSPPEGSSAVAPSPHQSSTSSTTRTPLATTSHPSTALMFSSLSSAGITGAPFSAGAAEATTQGQTAPGPVASTSHASSTIGARVSPTLGGIKETSTPQLASTPLTQTQPTLEVTATSSTMGSPSPSATKASVGSSAMIPPEEEETSTVNQGSRTTTDPSAGTSHSLPATSLVSTMKTVGEEGRRTDTTPTIPAWEQSSLRTSPRSGAVSPEFPTTENGTTTAPSMGTESSTAFSLSFSSAVTSHSSSSPEGSPAVTPSPQQNSISSTTETSLVTTSQPSTALVFSTAGVTGVGSDPVTAEELTPSPAPSTGSTNPVASASTTSPASDPTASSHSSTPGSSTETPTAQHTSTPFTQGQPTAEVAATSSPISSPSTTIASVGSSAMTPPGEEESSTVSQGTRTAEPTANTSYSPPSTSLATPSMTKLGISTSVNPSFTGTCSPITLSVQLQNVTSTMIQFSWKPQGGTGDSPYTVRLLKKSGEMEERILNETSTAFENLISGHQYQISVGVSTCSNNVSTSLTVQTAAEVYRGTTRITNEVFKSAYENKSSTEFKEFEKKFIMEITKHLPQKIQDLKNGTKIHIVINSIKAGSVIVSYDIVLDVGQNITKLEVSDAFREALNRSTVFEVDLEKTFVEARNSCEPGLNDCDENATCITEEAHYSCQCSKAFTDMSPQVPGRVCQQDLTTEHTTPVPPKTNTTGFTGSTSDSVFISTFTSAPCMTVSVEVQDVTGEEIQLSWTSSSKGSIYNISVMDGKEIIAKTTNETNAVLKNLLPGHVYNISVAVSSCAENNHTLVTVRTDSASCYKRTELCSAQSTDCSDLKDLVCSNDHAFACSIKLENLTFNNTLYNSESEGYKIMSERIKTDVVEGMQAELRNNHFNIVMLGFRPGSVVADFLFLLPKEEAMDVGDIQNQLRKALRDKFGSFQTEVEALSVQSSTDNSSSWRAAVIVLGILLGVALVLILLAILFYIFVRRRSGMEFSTLYTW